MTVEARCSPIKSYGFLRVRRYGRDSCPRGRLPGPEEQAVAELAANRQRRHGEMARRDDGHPDRGDVHPVDHHGPHYQLPYGAAVRLLGRELDRLHGVASGPAATPTTHPLHQALLLLPG